MWRGFSHGFCGGFPVVGTFSSLFFWLRPLIYFGLFILAVYVIYRLFFARIPAFQPRNKYLEILNERFAKGEITEEEYRRMKSILEEK